MKVEDRCGPGVPLVGCKGNPCLDAQCRGYSNAECRVNLCGTCKAVFYVNNQQVFCGTFSLILIICLFVVCLFENTYVLYMLKDQYFVQK